MCGQNKKIFEILHSKWRLSRGTSIIWRCHGDEGFSPDTGIQRCIGKSFPKSLRCEYRRKGFKLIFKERRLQKWVLSAPNHCFFVFTRIKHRRHGRKIKKTDALASRLDGQASGLSEALKKGFGFYWIHQRIRFLKENLSLLVEKE
ncbi:hypothetical protein CEXT_354831 [Caerostris extrusa]|uniref:Uncharacterized protein n=1 Tax=Caerostris extrusa TaxID=172846 RepID=A0AAV4UR95_CAEEX|nr:hypothetical protein CEXT_354831 [Caerostris extrusa]